jgi:hypothetical protein
VVSVGKTISITLDEREWDDVLLALTSGGKADVSTLREMAAQKMQGAAPGVTRWARRARERDGRGHGSEGGERARGSMRSKRTVRAQEVPLRDGSVVCHVMLSEFVDWPDGRTEWQRASTVVTGEFARDAVGGLDFVTDELQQVARLNAVEVTNPLLKGSGG